MTAQSALLADLIDNTPWLRKDANLRKRLIKGSAPDSSAWNAVNALLNSLDLQPYKTQPNEPEDSIARSKLQAISEFSHVPEVTDTQRRFSMDLMQPVSEVPPTRKTSLSKPAETALSHVNVTTKVTELEGKEYKPLYTHKTETKHKALHFLFGFPRERWDPLLLRKRKDRNLANPTLASAASDTGRIARDNTLLATATLSPEVTASRRRSLVNKHLPLYIREQIVETPVASSGALPEPGEVAGALVSGSAQHLRMPSYRSAGDAGIKTDDQRFNNLLANSLSFYYKAGNGHDSSAVDTSSVSDADKEYILPGLLARFTDYDHHDAYEQLDEDQEESEIEEDDYDDYLFR